MADKIYPQLNTERLVLRAFTLQDAERVQQLAGSRAVAETTLNIPHPYESGMAEAWISTHEASFVEGGGVVFAMVLAETNELIGAIGLTITQRFNHAELGYWVGQPFWGKGYATEAAAKLLAYGFDALKLHRIHATHMIHNPASGRVMEKIGMRKEGLLKEHALKWDQYVDLAVYGFLQSDWDNPETG